MFPRRMGAGVGSLAKEGDRPVCAGVLGGGGGGGGEVLQLQLKRCAPTLEYSYFASYS